ncbi:MAG: SGNH/GDSL hydrolase family protein [Chloroflexota bacterium]
MLVVSLLLPLLLLEAALRLFGPILPGNYNTGTFLTTDPVYGRFHVRGFDGWVKTREYTSRVTINALGLRGPERPLAKPPGVQRIVLLGDSFTEAVQVAEQDSTVSRLEASLNARGTGRYEVLNAGVGGWGTGQELVYLREEGYKLQPDLVVVLLYLGNDIFDNSYALQGSPKNPHEPYFTFRPDGSFEPIEFRTRKPEDVNPVVGALRGGSLLWNVFETGVLEKLDQGEDDDELRANRFNLNKMIVHAVKSSERQDDAWKTTLTLLQRVRQLGEEKGFKTAVVVAPAAFQVYDTDWDALLRDNKLKAADWSQDLPNQVLAANAGTIGAPMLDLLPSLRAAVPNASTMYYPYDKHWTTVGHAIAAREIERFLLEQSLVQ